MTKGDYQAIEFCLKEGVSVNAKNDEGQAPLHVAAKHNRRKAATTLMEHHPTVDIKNNSDCTPLAVAVLNKSGSVVGLLLRKGKANPALALHAAAEVDDSNRMEILLKHDKKVDPNSTNIDGDTPLHIAARKGHRSVARKLKGFGASLDLKNKDMLTPAEVADEAKHHTVAKILRR